MHDGHEGHAGHHHHHHDLEADAAEEIENSVADFKEGNLKLRTAFALLQK